MSLIWAPQPGPQKALIDCPHPLVFFGGARGGGKTDGVLGKWAIKAEKYGAAFRAIAFRRTTVSFEDAVERAKAIYKPLGWTFVGGNRPQFRHKNGARIGFRYLETVSDAGEYQGQNLTDVWVEEVGQYPLPGPVDRLFGVLRSAQGVPVQMIQTGNPGGPGQGWIRERYRLHPFPAKPLGTMVTINEGTVRCAVIPSRIQDNKALLEADPGYIDRLRLTGSKELVRAWLDGDWSAVEGAFFDGWEESKHVIRPFSIPDAWIKFRSIDWGYAAPFSVGWWAVVGDERLIEDRGVGIAVRGFEHDGYGVGGRSRYESERPGIVDHGARNAAQGTRGYEFGTGKPEAARRLPRGALVRYREWYGASAPGVGIRMDAQEVAAGILKREDNERIDYSVIDPAAFSTDSGPSIGEMMQKAGVMCRRADNRRIGQRGAMGGWDQMRWRLRGDGQTPMLYVFDTCKDFIRTVPVLQHDEAKPEDLDTEAEDHVADEARYACMSRPYTPPDVRVAKPRFDIVTNDDGTTLVSPRAIIEQRDREWMQ